MPRIWPSSRHDQPRQQHMLERVAVDARARRRRACRSCDRPSEPLHRRPAARRSRTAARAPGRAAARCAAGRHRRPDRASAPAAVLLVCGQGRVGISAKCAWFAWRVCTSAAAPPSATSSADQRRTRRRGPERCAGAAAGSRATSVASPKITSFSSRRRGSSCGPARAQRPARAAASMPKLRAIAPVSRSIGVPSCVPEVK